MTAIERYFNRHVMLELAPALVFLATNFIWGLTAATAALMAATAVAVAAGFALNRRMPVIPLVTLAIVLILGGASLWFDNEVFIKIKPTVGHSLFAAALALGLLFKPGFLERALGGQLHLTDQGWRILTFAWIALALAGAIANEAAWRLMETDGWVTFKTAQTFAELALYVVMTNAVARRYWNG